jgi:hypothetical protein
MPGFWLEAVTPCPFDTRQPRRAGDVASRSGRDKTATAMPSEQWAPGLRGFKIHRVHAGAGFPHVASEAEHQTCRDDRRALDGPAT